MSDLLPCPFCSGNAHRSPQTSDMCMIYCPECNVNMEAHEPWSNVEKAWNHRPTVAHGVTSEDMLLGIFLSADGEGVLSLLPQGYGPNIKAGISAIHAHLLTSHRAPSETVNLTEDRIVDLISHHQGEHCPVPLGSMLHGKTIRELGQKISRAVSYGAPSDDIPHPVIREGLLDDFGYDGYDEEDVKELFEYARSMESTILSSSNPAALEEIGKIKILDFIITQCQRHRGQPDHGLSNVLDYASEIREAIIEDLASVHSEVGYDRNAISAAIDSPDKVVTVANAPSDDGAANWPERKSPDFYSGYYEGVKYQQAINEAVATESQDDGVREAVEAIRKIHEWTNVMMPSIHTEAEKALVALATLTKEKS